MGMLLRSALGGLGLMAVIAHWSFSWVAVTHASQATSSGALPSLRDAASSTLDGDPPHTRRQLSERRGALGSNEGTAHR